MSETVTRYEIREASGVVVAIHERREDADGKRFVWRLPNGRSGLGDLNLADLPLYGTHLLGDWSGSRTIVVVEGEKAAQALLDVGVPALGTVTGASATPSRDVLHELAGRHVVLWPDVDPPDRRGVRVGHEHMRRVAANLEGLAASIRWIDWKDAPEHGDAADFLATYPAELVWDLIDMAGDVPSDELFERRGLGYFARKGDVELSFGRLSWSRGELHGELVIRHDGRHLVQTRFNASSDNTRAGMAKRLADMAPSLKVDWRAVLEVFCVKALAAERAGEPFRVVGRGARRPEQPYLIWPLMPENVATIVFGEGSSGKSTIAVAAAVSLSCGESVLSGWVVRKPTRVLVLDWEADEYEWNDRIAAVAKGAGLSAPEVDYRSCIGSLTDQIEDVAAHVAERGIGLVIVDSVGMASPTNREGSDANESAIRLFQALRHLRVSSLLIDHVSKAGADQEHGAIRPYGSIFKVNLARSVWEMKRGDGTTELGHAALYHRKCNGSSLVKPWGLAIEYGDDYIRFDREAIEDEALSSAMPLDRRIEELLRTGPLTPREIADQLGENRSSVRSKLHRLDGKRFTHVEGDRWGLCYVA